MKLEVILCEGYALLKANVIFINRSAQIMIYICMGLVMEKGKLVQI